MPDSVLEVLDRPTYSPTFASSLIGLSPGRIRRWLRGYEYDYTDARGASRRVKQRPVVTRAGAEGSSYASFLDLVDLLFVKAFLDRGISLPKIRRALDEAQEVMPGHHFAQRSFFTEGRKIYVEVEAAGGSDALLELLADGQWVIGPVIKHRAKQLEFDDETGFAERWYPLGKRGGVVLDPRIAFGAPTIPRRGVKTAVLYDLFEAERGDINRVTEWMKLRPTEVAHAIEFEHHLRTAA